MTPTPDTVELKREAALLLISWDDGHESEYPLRYLRGFCPCAHCQGHAPGDWTFVPVDAPAVTKIEPVGNYALRIAYSDGHDTGIYSFEILRELCPCDSCRTALGERHATCQLPAEEA